MVNADRHRRLGEQLGCRIVVDQVPLIRVEGHHRTVLHGETPDECRSLEQRSLPAIEQALDRGRIGGHGQGEVDVRAPACSPRPKIGGEVIVAMG